MNDYWFFLSYARRNDISYTTNEEGQTKQLVRRFYEELAAEIVSRGNTGAATKAEEIGFFDQVGIEPGDTWSEPVAEGLRTARVMLCLYTRNYFRSRVSGQEVDVFLRRVTQYARAKRLVLQPPLLIPVLWHREELLPSPLPPAVADLQYRFDQFPRVYAEEGLEYIMRTPNKHGDDYQQFLIRFADLLVRAAEEHPMPTLPVCPPLSSARNLFEREAGAPAAEEEEAGKGPGFLHFVFVVGRRSELEGIRSRLDPYANDARLWKPYVPAADRAVALFTQRAATDAELQHDVIQFTPALLDQLAEADDTNTMVILIVDPWTLNVPLYERQMREYDKRNLVSCGVLILWNDLEQDQAATDALRARVKQTFRNVLTNNNMHIRAEVSSEADFRNELAAAIVEIRRRLNERANLLRPVDTAGYNAVPQLATPAGGTP